MGQPQTLIRTHLPMQRMLGFSKTYNFLLWILFGGTLLAFAVVRLPYLNIDGVYARNAAPGEWYWQHAGWYRLGIIIHLSTILPCSILVVFQFVPTLREKYTRFHIINGYIVMMLFLISNVGAIMVTPRSLGGGSDIQASMYLLILSSTVSLGLAWYNIRQKQIEQHRAWMLRAMAYMGCIVTMRLFIYLGGVLFTTAAHVTPYYQGVWSCEQLKFTFDHARNINYPGGSRHDLAEFYPICAQAALQNLSTTFVPIKVDPRSDNIAEIAMSVAVGFSPAAWFAFILHALGVELYLAMTPKEAERLRMISYKRQRAAGLKHAGSAGLVVEKWGDAKPWKPRFKTS
ncbi:hypothetical protein AJ80_02078 [Polytolypa hystricis UAMH7299]|uniref:DUF2306 domain-containing protein n=1 Tax=Polytolypa hystricis (strain UAMH7299) TaxID=1447883 RepID=A0A2B7YRM7_POLH7|nr:hypothetical protein AJ80_02078 [Polytolypa hystricis UAMH7299]